jgi:hypothetical protein
MPSSDDSIAFLTPDCIGQVTGLQLLEELKPVRRARSAAGLDMGQHVLKVLREG